MDLHPQPCRRACKAPAHGVMASHAANWVPQGAQPRLRRFGHQVELGAKLADGLAVDNLAVHAQVLVGFGSQSKAAHRCFGLGQRERAASGKHHIEAEFLAQSLVQLQRPGIEADRLGGDVVGAYHLCVASRVSAAEVASFDHRDSAHAVPTRQEVGRGQAMAAPTNDRNVIARAQGRSGRQVGAAV